MLRSWWEGGFGIAGRGSKYRRHLKPTQTPHLEELESRLTPSVLVWSDEFNGPVGSGPDPTKWTYDLGGGGWGNNELEVYTNSLQNASIVADPAATDGTALDIQAIKQSDGTYTSARLKTQGLQSWTYGRFEARARLPYGQGMWPAFWLLGSNIGSVGWPNCGEIDAMENIGREPSTVHGTMHGPGYSGANGITASYTLPNGQQFKDAYHTFDVDWTPTTITWSVDGQVYETRTRADLPQGTNWVFDHSFFVLLNLAVGGNWPGNPDGTTVFPQNYLIDYVRIYADIPTGWSDADIGVPGQVGGAAYDSPSGTWTVAGGGADIWGASDQFNLAAQPLAGDGSVIARVTGVQNTDPWAKAGVMLRASTAANDAFADVVATPGNGVAFEWRAVAGGQAADVHVTGLNAPIWVQLTRVGNAFSGYYSTDGSTWTQIGTSQTIGMPTTVQAGLAVTAHNNGLLNTSTFDNVAVNATPATHFTVSLPTSTTAGTPLSVTVTALDQYGNAVPTYVGTVHFASSDRRAVLPANYTFTTGDAGVHAFANGVILKTAGTRSVTTTDTVTASIAGTASVAVSPAAAARFQLTAPASVTAGSPFNITVTAFDAYGNVATGYLGAIHFTSSDTATGVVLPADYTFTTKDLGRHTFTGVILKTAGLQTITATDTLHATIKGSGKTTVNAPHAIAAEGLEANVVDELFGGRGLVASGVA
jgi:beta-glucanase (GH16 family)